MRNSITENGRLYKQQADRRISQRTKDSSLLDIHWDDLPTDLKTELREKAGR